MRKNALSSTGLSMSQAQSYSNIMNQRSVEIERMFNKINNYSNTIDHNGKVLQQKSPFPIPADLEAQLKLHASYRACQAFLMESIKAKEALINEQRDSTVNFEEEFPKQEPSIPSVSEEWGWEQLSVSELVEYYEKEQLAATYGKFIHSTGVLTKLRDELPKIKEIEWITIKREELSPSINVIHHTAEQLHSIHEKLALLHSEAEKRVNYFKSKVKNLVTVENARIAEANVQIIKNNSAANREYQSRFAIAQQTFEKEKSDNIKLIVQYRIEVPTRFQAVIDTISGGKQEQADA